MRRKNLLAMLGTLCFAVAAAASDNVFVVSDTLAYMGKAFGVRAKATAWFVQNGGSTLNFSYPGKGSVNFHLTQTAAGDRSVDQIQIEPAPGALSISQANGYATYLTGTLGREGRTCSPVRNDQDGINAFLIFSCAEKTVPAVLPTEMAVTVQSVGGRNLVFVRFAPKKR